MPLQANPNTAPEHAKKTVHVPGTLCQRMRTGPKARHGKVTGALPAQTNLSRAFARYPEACQARGSGELFLAFGQGEYALANFPFPFQ